MAWVLTNGMRERVKLERQQRNNMHTRYTMFFSL